MNIKDWIKKYNGTKIDYDGVYGIQCVDLVDHYIKYVLGYNPPMVKGAKDFWNNRNKKAFKDIFIEVINTKDTVPHLGDLFVRNSGTYGHIGVVGDGSSNKYFYAYEQNHNGTGQGMTLYKNTEWNYINFLRPRFQYVSANGGLHGYMRTNSKTPSILIPNDSRVEIIKTECFNKIVNGKSYMMSQIKYKGVKYYVADIYIKVK